MKRAITYLLLSGLSAAAAPQAFAAYHVRFLDGRSLVAQAVDREGALTVLTLAGGGTVGIRSSRISGIDEVPEAPAAPEEKLQDASAAPPAEAVAPARATGRPLSAGPQDAVRDALEVGTDVLMGPGETGGYAALIRRAAVRHGVDAELLRCLLLVESSFDPRAVSPKGARGLAQLMPGTAQELGVKDPFDAREAVDAAARLLGRLLEENQGQFVPALAAYNAGPGAVRRYGGIPPYGETIRYVEKVLSLYHASSGE